MRCEEIQERLVDLLYDEIGTPPASAELRAHMDSCPRCRTELEQLQKLRGTLKKWRDESPIKPVFLPLASRPKTPWAVQAWGILKHAAVAVLVVLAFLALANSEITWNKQGFAFKSYLLSRGQPRSDYYTKAELREILRQVMDESERQMTESTYQMILRMMDTIEQERWREMRLVSKGSLRDHSKN